MTMSGISLEDKWDKKHKKRIAAITAVIYKQL